MGQKTDIEWCDSTVNPNTGCDGCELWGELRKSCYAGPIHEGRLASAFPGLYAPDFTEVRLAPGRTVKAAAYSDLTGKSRPGKPWLDGMPRTIFVGDMGDIFSKAVPFGHLKSEVVDVALSRTGRQHIWMLLTKRPGRALRFQDWLGWNFDWPRNIWIGTSITDQRTWTRADSLCFLSSAVRFLSLEPLVGPLESAVETFQWVIVGGESGPRARPFDLDWARRLRDECGKLNVPFFMKQLGSNPIHNGCPLKLRDHHGGDWDEWPNDLRIRQMPWPRRVPNHEELSR